MRQASSDPKNHFVEVRVRYQRVIRMSYTLENALWLAKILLGFEIKSLRRFVSSRWAVTTKRCSISCGSVWAPLPVWFALVAASY